MKQNIMGIGVKLGSELNERWRKRLFKRGVWVGRSIHIRMAPAGVMTITGASLCTSLGSSSSLSTASFLTRATRWAKRQVEMVS